MADWVGNSQSIYAPLGASNHSNDDREINDYYATSPKAMQMLLDKVEFSNSIWECACGGGHLSDVLAENGYAVWSTDLYDHGYGETGLDFLSCDEPWEGDIITNPPYKYAKEFVEKAMDLITPGHKVAMFLKVQFLEGQARRELFQKYPPAYVYVSSGRIPCAKNGEFRPDGTTGKSSAVAYAWYIWEKPCNHEPIIRWFN